MSDHDNEREAFEAWCNSIPYYERDAMTMREIFTAGFEARAAVLDRHGVKPAASTGNTEELPPYADSATLHDAPVPRERWKMQTLASPSSPVTLLEDDAVFIMVSAAREEDAKVTPMTAKPYGRMRAAYRALLPHLSDTSAENRIASFKARCEAAENLSVAMSAHTVALIEYSTKQDARVSGLVEALRDTLFCNGHTLTPHVKQKIRVALAALEKGE